MPKTWFVGSVRSGGPSCPPFGLHCAAARLRCAVVDKLKTPWDVVGGFDRRTSGPRCPCTAVEDSARLPCTECRISAVCGNPGVRWGRNLRREAFHGRYVSSKCIACGRGGGGQATWRARAPGAGAAGCRAADGEPVGAGRAAPPRISRRVRGGAPEAYG